mmetsp:Transcript_10407/g.16809  ORF Transcript_10407/g.16809 Transcript_10407/m.16809 type:complete len:205 (-) Transcript_10407:291-905(-)
MPSNKRTKIEPPINASLLRINRRRSDEPPERRTKRMKWTRSQQLRTLHRWWMKMRMKRASQLPLRPQLAEAKKPSMRMRRTKRRRRRRRSRNVERSASLLHEDEVVAEDELAEVAEDVDVVEPVQRPRNPSLRRRVRARSRRRLHRRVRVRRNQHDEQRLRRDLSEKPRSQSRRARMSRSRRKVRIKEVDLYTCYVKVNVFRFF